MLRLVDGTWSRFILFGDLQGPALAASHVETSFLIELASSFLVKWAVGKHGAIINQAMKFCQKFTYTFFSMSRLRSSIPVNLLARPTEKIGFCSVTVDFLG